MPCFGAHIRYYGLLIGWCGALLACLTPACTRSAPPDIPEFRPPAKTVVEEKTAEVVADTSGPVEETPAPKPEPAPEPKPIAKAPAPKPEPVKPKEVKAEAPTLVGTWRVTEMSHKGQPNPEMDKMEMTFTFTKDGNVTMTVSAPQMPEPMTRAGTYSLNGEQLTITMNNDTKTGTCTFDGNSRVTLDIDEAKMTLTRS